MTSSQRGARCDQRGEASISSRIYRSHIQSCTWRIVGEGRGGFTLRWTTSRLRLPSPPVVTVRLEKKAWVSMPTSAFARPTPAARVYVNPLGCGDATRRTPRGICRRREAMLVGRKPMYLHVCVITLPPPPRKFGSLLVLVCRMAHAHVVTRIIVALGSGWER